MRDSRVRTLEILLVEDSPADVRLTLEALRRSDLPCGLRVARDGEQALAMLRREGEHAGLPQPDLVLLDLNLPRLDGQQVLASIKNDPRTRHIPVLILSTSAAESDVAECYRRHANCYLRKPVDFEGFARLIQQVQDLWLHQALLPRRRGGRHAAG